MKVSTQTLALLGLSGLSVVAAEVVQSGAYCPMTSYVTCKLQNGQPCSSLAKQPYEDCGMKTLKYGFKYCNNREGNVIKTVPNLTVAKVNSEKQTNLELWADEPMETGCRTAQTVNKIIDTCAMGSTAMSLKIEGRLQDSSGNTMQGDGNYCYSWAYLSTKIRVDPPDEPFTDDGPDEEPFTDDDTAPFTDPVEDDVFVPANISMSISCAYELVAGSRSFTESCDTIGSVLPPNGECVRDIQFKYAVTNNHGKEQARLQALVDETNTDLIQDENSVLIEARTTWEDTKIVEIDLCKEVVKEVVTKATAVAASVSGGLVGTAKASYKLVVPSTGNVVYEYVSPDEVTCMYNGEDCGKLAATACFSGEVDLTHTIKNVGDTCHNIAKVRALFHTDKARYLAIDGSYGCASRLSCPNDEFTFTEKRFVDFCDANGAITVAITVETDSGDETTASTILQIDANTDAPFTDGETGGEEPIVCNSHPSEMWFEFTHRNCDGSSNSQFTVPKLRRRGLRHNASSGSSKDTSKTKDKKSSKTDVVVVVDERYEEPLADSPVYSCKQLQMFGNDDDAKVRIVITSVDEKTLYWSGADICTGTDIHIGAEDGKSLIASDIMVRIYGGVNGDEIQQIIMHTGCTSHVMTVDETFGAFQLTGFRNASV